MFYKPIPAPPWPPFAARESAMVTSRFQLFMTDWKLCSQYLSAGMADMAADLKALPQLFFLFLSPHFLE